MTRRFWLLLSATLVSLPALTDWAVDHQFRQRSHENVGYSTSDSDGVTMLIAKADGERDCGEDWLCLIQWAEEKHAVKRRRP